MWTETKNKKKQTNEHARTDKLTDELAHSQIYIFAEK